jgi:DNA polymerase III epsilon subunit-like protein
MNMFILDFETSGLNPYRDDIIEIGIKKYMSDESYQTLVVPESRELVSEQITKITHITNDAIFKEGINFETAYSNLYNFIIENSNESVPIVYLLAHNGNSFDFIFFKRILYHLRSKKMINTNVEIEFKYLDTLNLSRRLLDHQSYKMSSLCKRFHIENTEEHRALGDVLALEEIFNKLLFKWRKSEILDNTMTLDSMIKYTNFNV